MTTNRHSSWFRTLLILCALLGAGLLALGIVQDRSVVEKIGTALVMPTGVLWILMLALSIQLWRQPKLSHVGQPGAIAATFCFLIYSVAGNGFVADWLTKKLEADYLTTDPMKEPPMDTVIVLGGGGGLGANGRLQGNRSGDRMILAAQLYHQKITQQFICTGQRIPSMNLSSVDPAETSRDILLKLGVPDSAIQISEGRNTYEELRVLSERLRNSEQRIGLLTSAWHLPRAMRLAERNGLHPIPIPADFYTAANTEPLTTGQILESMIPNSFAISVTCACAKEYLGILLGR